MPRGSLSPGWCSASRPTAFPGSSVVIDGTVFSAAALAPYSVAGAKRTHSQTLLVGSSCNYEIWYKYKPNYPAGTEAWFFDGAYFC